MKFWEFWEFWDAGSGDYGVRGHSVCDQFSFYLKNRKGVQLPQLNLIDVVPGFWHHHSQLTALFRVVPLTM